MRWINQESFDDKLQRVKAAVVKAQERGRQVTLIGESAGATTAFNAYALDPSIYGIVTLCGITTSKTPISPTLLSRKLAFKEAVSRLDKARETVLARPHRITVITAHYDASVPVRLNQVSGTRHIKIWSVGHLTTVLLCLTIYSFIIVRAVKRS